MVQKAKRCENDEGLLLRSSLPTYLPLMANFSLEEVISQEISRLLVPLGTFTWTFIIVDQKVRHDQ